MYNNNQFVGGASTPLPPYAAHLGATCCATAAPLAPSLPPSPPSPPFPLPFPVGYAGIGRVVSTWGGRGQGRGSPTAARRGTRCTVPHMPLALAPAPPCCAWRGRLWGGRGGGRIDTWCGRVALQVGGQAPPRCALPLLRGYAPPRWALAALTSATMQQREKHPGDCRRRIQRARTKP